MSDRNKEIGGKFELLGQVSDVKNTTRVRRSRTAENIAAVAESVEENLGLSIPRRFLEKGIPQTSLHRFLGLKDYKVQLTQELKPEFHRKTILIDEAHFHLVGFVNKQNVASGARKTQELLLKSLSILNV